MEKADNVFVYPSDFGWSDLGTWGSLYSHLKLDESQNGIIGENIMIYDSKNNIINAPNDKVVVVQGLENYIIIDNKNTLLICKKEDEQQIKQFVNDIKRDKGDEYIVYFFRLPHSSGRTHSSNSLGVRYPKLTASSFNVVPFW